MRARSPAPHGVQGEGRGNLTPSRPSPLEGEGEDGGLLRRPAKRGAHRNDTFLIAFVLDNEFPLRGFDYVVSQFQPRSVQDGGSNIQDVHPFFRQCGNLLQLDPSSKSNFCLMGSSLFL